MALDGVYETTVKSPLGDQKATLTVKTDGATWSGSQVGAMGSAEIAGGTIDGNTLSWTMNVSVPMPMSLDCKATIDGDTVTGTVTAGAFGSFPLTGSRVG